MSKPELIRVQLFAFSRDITAKVWACEIETGIAVDIGTATGSFRAFGHELTLTVLGIEIVSTVYFAESEYFDRNVLGRIGWLDRVKMSLIESEGKLFLSEHGE